MLGVGVGPDGLSAGPSAGRRGEMPARLGDEDRDALAVLLSVDGLGPLTLGRLVDRLASPAAILEAAVAADGPRTLLESSRSTEGEWRTMPRTVADAIAVAAG